MKYPSLPLKNWGSPVIYYSLFSASIIIWLQILQHYLFPTVVTFKNSLVWNGVYYIMQLLGLPEIMLDLQFCIMLFEVCHHYLMIWILTTPALCDMRVKSKTSSEKGREKLYSQVSWSDLIWDHKQLWRFLTILYQWRQQPYYIYIYDW